LARALALFRALAVVQPSGQRSKFRVGLSVGQSHPLGHWRFPPSPSPSWLPPGLARQASLCWERLMLAARTEKHPPPLTSLSRLASGHPLRDLGGNALPKTRVWLSTSIIIVFIGVQVLFGDLVQGLIPRPPPVLERLLELPTQGLRNLRGIRFFDGLIVSFFDGLVEFGNHQRAPVSGCENVVAGDQPLFQSVLFQLAFKPFDELGRGESVQLDAAVGLQKFLFLLGGDGVWWELSFELKPLALQPVFLHVG